MPYKLIIYLFALCTTFLTPTATAYIGPGAGIGAIGTVLLLLALVIIAIIGFIWLPLKRLGKKEKKEENIDFDSE